MSHDKTTRGRRGMGTLCKRIDAAQNADADTLRRMLAAATTP